jgi:hypothetical protein
LPAHRHPELTEQTVWEVFEAERPKLAGHFAGRHPEYPGLVDRRKQEVQLAGIAECIVTANEYTGPEGFSELQRTCCRSA